MLLETKVRVCLVVVYVALACGYVAVSLAKFWSARVASDTRRESEGDTIEYPSVTVCSGFRDLALEPRRIAAALAASSSSQEADPFASPQEKSQDERMPDRLDLATFKSLTYDRGEVISYFTQAKDGDWSDDHAKDERVWTEHLHPYFGGRCHTWEPREETRPGQLDTLDFGLRFPAERNLTEGFACWFTRGNECLFPVFLHEKGAFHYSKALKFSGRTLLYPESGLRLNFVLTKRRFELLPKEHRDCSRDYGTAGWLACVRRAYRDARNCTYPWEVEDASGNDDVCDMDGVNAGLTSKEEASWWQDDDVVAADTGCTLPCSYIQYAVELNKYASNVIPSGWIYPEDTACVLSFRYADSTAEVTSEYPVFDAFSLTGEVGGALGLFLGWSALNSNVAFVLAVAGWMAGSSRGRAGNK